MVIQSEKYIVFVSQDLEWKGNPVLLINSPFFSYEYVTQSLWWNFNEIPRGAFGRFCNHIFGKLTGSMIIGDLISTNPIIAPIPNVFKLSTKWRSAIIIHPSRCIVSISAQSMPISFCVLIHVIEINCVTIENRKKIMIKFRNLAWKQAHARCLMHFWFRV